MAQRDEIGARRRKAERRGHVSEYVAAAYLLLKGYRILALRHRTKLGEIDLIARKRDLVVFVEVKARRSEMQALDAVSFASQKRIRAASPEELLEVPGIGRALAEVIERELTGTPAEPTVNLMTGEIVDEHKESNE